MTELNAEHARTAIVGHTRRLADAAAAAGPGAPVPTAPEWSITELVEHVGQTQNWIATWRPVRQPAEVTVSGPGGSLLLAMTRRLPLSASDAAGIAIDGDLDLAQHWLDNAAHLSG